MVRVDTNGMASRCYIEFGRQALRSIIARTWLVLALVAPPAFSVVPSSDPSFGGGNVVVQPFLGLGGRPTSLFIQPDGGIVVSGWYVGGRSVDEGTVYIPVVARYQTDGSIDPSFAGSGVIDHAPLLPHLMQSDGKLVTLGASGLHRLEANGSLDASLDTTGAAGREWFAGLYDWSLVQQADRKIVVAGSLGPQGAASIALARFNLDGSLDVTFNGFGAFVAPTGPSSNDNVAGLVVQPDGKLVVAATSDVATARAISLLRYLPDGTLDSNFGVNGRVVPIAPDSDLPRSASLLALQPGGRLIVAGLSYPPSQSDPIAIRVVGVSPAGMLDAAFGSGGEVVIAPDDDHAFADVLALAVQPDGKLIILSHSSGSLTRPDKYSVVRLRADGSRDATFGANGAWSPEAFGRIAAMGLQGDGKLVIAGEVGASASDGQFALGRYLAGSSAAVEFYHEALDHYFLSVNAHEVRDLDLGVHPGWVRTGLSFEVYGSPQAAPSGFVAACRFYIPPNHGDSHFFSASPEECAAVAARAATDPNYSGYVYESPMAFFVALPDAVGVCPPATIAVYRLWNARSDSNHRYTTNLAIKAQLLALGYVAEGYGQQAVAMCAALQV